MYSIRRILIEGYPTLLLGALIVTTAGIMLNSSTQELNRLPLILVMMPVVNGSAGNIGSILGARLSSALHLGTIEPRLKGQKLLKENILATLLISLGTFLFASVLFFAIGIRIGMAASSSLALTLAFLMTGGLVSVLLVLVTVAFAFASFRGGLDPDNVVIPIMTSVMDVLGVTCLLLSVKIMGV
ncbi:MAG: magnesium transporter [Candidatus Hadarchaeota archaeon]